MWKAAYYGVIGLIYAFVLIPILVIICISFDSSPLYSFPPTSFSLRWYESFFYGPLYLKPFFQVSLPIGLATGVIATILGTLAAFGLDRSHPGLKRRAELLFLTPLLIPELLLGVSWYISFAALKIKPTMTNIVLGHVIVATPYVIRNVIAGLAGFDRRLEEAAANLGANAFDRFRLVTVPLLRSSIISGAVFAFIISFSDVNISIFLSGADVTTLPVQIFSQLQFEEDPTIAAASSMQIVLIGALLFMLQRMFGLRPQ